MNKKILLLIPFAGIIICAYKFGDYCARNDCILKINSVLNNCKRSTKEDFYGKISSKKF